MYIIQVVLNIQLACSGNMQHIQNYIIMFCNVKNNNFLVRFFRKKTQFLNAFSTGMLLLLVLI